MEKTVNDILVVDSHGIPKDVSTRATDVSEIARIFERQSRGSYYGSAGTFKTSSWIYAIVSAIATSVGEIPFETFRAKGSYSSRFSSKNWVPFYDEQLSNLINKPNKLQRFKSFIEQWATSLALTGNVWGIKDEVNSLGLPRNIILLGPDMVRPIRKNIYGPPEAWAIRTFTGEEVVASLEDVIHWKLPNAYDQWIGMPPPVAIEYQLDADRARVAYDKFFYRNNATPDAVLTYKPGMLNKASREAIYESWMDAYGGEDKHGGLAVIGGDFDLKVMGISHSASEYIKNREFTRQEAAAIYAYPVQLLNDLEGGGIGRDQLTVARMMKYENVIFPYCSRFAEGFSEEFIKTIPKYSKIYLYPDYDGLPVMVDFMNTKADTLVKLVGSGVPLNNVLAKLDMGIDSVEGGDVGLIAGKPINQAGETPVALDPPKEVKTKSYNVYHQNLKTLFKRSILDVRNALLSSGKADAKLIKDKISKRIQHVLILCVNSNLTNNYPDKNSLINLLQNSSYMNSLEIRNEKIAEFFNRQSEVIYNIIDKLCMIDSSDIESVDVVFNNANNIADSISLKIIFDCENFTNMAKYDNLRIIKDLNCKSEHLDLNELVSPSRSCFCLLKPQE